MPAIDPIHMRAAAAASSPPRRVHRAPPPPPLTPPPLTPCALPSPLASSGKQRGLSSVIEFGGSLRFSTPYKHGLPARITAAAMPPWSADRAEDAAATAVAYTIDDRDSGAPAATAGAARVSGGGGGGGAGRSRSSGGGGRSGAPRVEIEIRAAAAVGGGWHERLLAAVLQFFGDQKGAFARCFSTMAASPPAASEAEKDAAAARIQKAFVGTKTAPAYGDLEA